MKKKSILTGVMALSCAVVLTACSSSGGSSSPTTAGSGGGSAAGLARAKAIVDAYAKEPSKIANLAGLPMAPPKGLKVTFLSCSSPSCTPLNAGFTDATKALGWDPTVLTYNSATPGQALQQAIDSGAQMIASTSVQLNQIGPQLAELRSKNIPFFEAYTLDEPGGTKNWLFGNTQSTAANTNIGMVTGAYIINKSQGNAHVVGLQLPLYPSNTTEVDGDKQELAKDCPSCTFAPLSLSVDQLTKGQGPSTVIAYLKAHPNVNYVVPSFSDLDTGLVAALKGAGLSDKVHVVSDLPNTAVMSELVNGSELAGIVVPQAYVMWVVVDQMARQSVGVLDQTALDATAKGLEFIVDTPADASAQIAKNNGIWPGPDNYQQQFQTLWKVSS